MSRLTDKQRKHLSADQFAGPGRTFPINDKTHERKAIELAPRAYHAGNISHRTEQRIIRKAERKLHKGKKGLGDHMRDIDRDRDSGRDRDRDGK